jgi:hypothetical protein
MYPTITLKAPNGSEAEFRVGNDAEARAVQANWDGLNSEEKNNLVQDAIHLLEVSDLGACSLYLCVICGQVVSAKG